MTRLNYLEWFDANGRLGRQTWCQVDDTVPDDLIAAINAHSALGLYRRVEGDQVVVSAAASGTPYVGRETIAILTFCTAANNVVRFTIRGPNMDIFTGADGDIVDATAIADVITAALGTLCDVAGNPVVRYTGGVLSSIDSGSAS